MWSLGSKIGSLSTISVTTVAEAQAVVNFTGNAVAIFGSTGPSPEYGSYTVQVDSRPPLNFTRNAFLVTQQVLLVRLEDSFL
jgi:hypothetical protein